MAKPYPLQNLFQPGFVSPRIKPTIPVEIDWTHPLTKGLRLFYLHNDRANLATGNILTFTDIDFEVDGQLGMTTTVDSYSGDDSIEFEAFDCTNWAGVSCFSVARVHTTLTTFDGIISSVPSGGFDGNFNLAMQENIIRWRAGTGVSTDTATFSGGDKVACIGTWDLATQKTYQSVNDGAITTNSTANTSSFSGSVAENYIGYYSRGGGRSFQGNISVSGIWDRELSESEARSLIENPYQILRPAIPVQFFVAGAAGGFSISCNLESLTLTEFQSNTDLDFSIASALESLTLTENTASVSFGYNVACSLETLTLTEFQSDTDLDFTISGTLESLTLTENNANVSLGVTVSCNQESLTLTEFQSDTDLDFAIAANLETLTLTEFRSNTDLDFPVNCSLESLELTDNNATVDFVAGDFNISATLESLALTDFNSSITYTGSIWIVQANDSSTWTAQTNDSSSWTIQ